jgi:chloramphenicol 3-O-phosphotransferase
LLHKLFVALRLLSAAEWAFRPFKNGNTALGKQACPVCFTIFYEWLNCKKKIFFWVVVFAQSLYNRVMAFRRGSISANREAGGQIACTVGRCRCILGN